MKIAFYGSSIVSAYWNGAATYYRGLLRALALKGHDITFYEPDVFERQQNRDISPPAWCKVVVYQGSIDALRRVTAEATNADVVIKASGVGFEDELLLDELLRHARPQALKIFWDVDAPATLSDLRSQPNHPLRQALARLDLVLTYGGGVPVVEAYRQLGAIDCVPIYNALDPETHYPVEQDMRFAGELGFLGNRLPDRETRVEEFFFGAARRRRDHAFLLGGSGWDDKPMSNNVAYLGHVSTRDHNAFNVTPKAVLNISRDSMARNGFSPATRVFEAAGAGACLITDNWDGIELFLAPNSEVLVARDGKDVAEIVAALSSERAAAIGKRALARVLSQHTYKHRADIVDMILRSFSARRLEAAQ